ncbi:hypothetical protein [Streptacidiphilus neutrinimicus]|uniref:hypothetical protein n=1 Tax=Streptacidiphilus neutrinimicus TaxID=105420 RepID=UPI000693EE5B|nr:hypothetical protein [Streptacidiphilus neutrinimicus]
MILPYALPRAAALLAAAALLSGCTATEGALNAQPDTPSPTCLVHQSKDPATRYTAGTSADTLSILELMRYYTANGTKPFCDGKPATATDHRWMDLYTRLGGDRTHISHEVAGREEPFSPSPPLSGSLRGGR